MQRQFWQEAELQIRLCSSFFLLFKSSALSTKFWEFTDKSSQKTLLRFTPESLFSGPPNNTPECSHRVWSRNGQKGCLCHMTSMPKRSVHSLSNFLVQECAVTALIQYAFFLACYAFRYAVFFFFFFFAQIMLKNIICFLPYIMPNYSRFCLIMLRTRSACPSTQQARTSACIAEIHI